MDKTKISRFGVSSQAISRLGQSLDIHMSYYLIIRTTALVQWSEDKIKADPFF